MMEINILENNKKMDVENQEFKFGINTVQLIVLRQQYQTVSQDQEEDSSI